MANKLKLRRLRRLKDDVAWWIAEAFDWKQIALEHAVEIDRLRKLVIRVPMPVIVPTDIVHQLNGKGKKEDPLCRSCNDGTRHGCSSCAYRMK